MATSSRHKPPSSARGNYLTKRRLVSAARKGIRIAAARTMQVMGYTIVAQNGWIVKKYPDGTIQKIEKLASTSKKRSLRLD